MQRAEHTSQPLLYQAGWPGPMPELAYGEWIPYSSPLALTLDSLRLKRGR